MSNEEPTGAFRDIQVGQYFRIPWTYGIKIRIEPVKLSNGRTANARCHATGAVYHYHDDTPVVAGFYVDQAAQ